MVSMGHLSALIDHGARNGCELLPGSRWWPHPSARPGTARACSSRWPRAGPSGRAHLRALVATLAGGSLLGVLAAMPAGVIPGALAGFARGTDNVGY